MATAYISRTPAGAGNQKTWTLSGWFKFADLATVEIFGLSTASNDASTFSFVRDNTGALRVDLWTAYTLVTNRRLRDPSAWYHIVLRVDTTDSTADDRVRLYINGTQETSFSTRNNPALNYDFIINSTTAHFLGVRDYSGSKSLYFNGEMSHVQFVDGLALAPTEFGEVDSTSGMWKLKTGSYGTPGTNGFHLKMEDSSNLDLDSSSNAHTFATTGTLTATKDNPSNNFCTINPLENYYPASTFSNGNNTILQNVGSGSIYAPNISTLGMSAGKWYWEYKYTARSADNATFVGITSTQTSSAADELGDFPNDWAYYSFDGKSYNDSTMATYDNSWDTNDIIGVALDLTNSKLYFSKNGTWQNSGVPTSGATGTGALSITAAGSTPLGAYFAASGYWHSGTLTSNFNFGNGYFGTTAISSGNADDAGIGDFEYDVPAGYYALCTKNIKAYG